MLYYRDMALYKLYFDGSCGPKNPGGTAAHGFVLLREGQEEPVRVGSGVIGTGTGMTNNLAEFHALDQGLCAFISCHEAPGARHALQVYGDSQLVVNIMNRHWKARPGKAYYESYANAVLNLGIIRRAGYVVSFDWIPREKNQLCDDLSKAHQEKSSK